eukprot:12532405-Heterocapsa_arctica.AAC.1
MEGKGSRTVWTSRGSRASSDQGDGEGDKQRAICGPWSALGKANERRWGEGSQPARQASRLPASQPAG